MSSEYSVSDDVKELINDIIISNNWGPVIDVKYYPGTEAGDGYVSKHVAVDIIREDQTSRLFVKYALNLPGTAASGMDKIYANEVYFYETVYPKYVEFVKKKAIENGFDNVPKCYGTSTKNVIALDNVREKGYVLFNRKETMNDKHLELVLKTFAKLHAISYALKDQAREAYDKLVQGTNEDFIVTESDNPMAKMMRTMITDATSKLDPVADKSLIDKCDADILIRSVVDSRSYYDKYSILTQGDCWCNNMMFLYENGDKEAPTDVILVDWQMLRPAPPVLDISYFFYTIASEESLSKLDYYLKVYYEELQYQIRAMGSDPDTLYPFSAFENHWKKYCKYGFAMAFMILKVMLLSKDEVPSMEEMDVEALQKSETINVFTKFSSEDEYIRKIKLLGHFMVKNEYL